MCNLVFYNFQGVFLFLFLLYYNIIQEHGHYDKFKKVNIKENISNINVQTVKKVNNEENKEIKQLKEELTKSKKIINQLNNKIKELENKLQIENNKYLKKIKELENNIIQKNNELNQLKTNLQNNNSNVNFNNHYNNIIQNKDKSVTFISNDQSICFSIPCSGNSTFAEVEELLYREYPDLRETNNIFLANGKQILRFKTINENNAGTGRPVMLIKPVE